jgi:hypothetical protein
MNIWNGTELILKLYLESLVSAMNKEQEYQSDDNIHCNVIETTALKNHSYACFAATLDCELDPKETFFFRQGLILFEWASEHTKFVIQMKKILILYMKFHSTIYFFYLVVWVKMGFTWYAGH